MRLERRRDLPPHAPQLLPLALRPRAQQLDRRPLEGTRFHAVGFRADLPRQAVHLDEEQRSGVRAARAWPPTAAATASSESLSTSSSVAGTTRAANQSRHRLDRVLERWGTSRGASPRRAALGSAAAMIFVMIASVPSDPTRSCVRS